MGRWERDCVHGTGQLQWADGTVFRGRFVHDEPHGWGHLCLGGKQQPVPSLPEPAREPAAIRDWAESLRRRGMPVDIDDDVAVASATAEPAQPLQAMRLPSVSGGIHITERFIHGYPSPVRTAAKVSTALLVLAALLFLLPHGIQLGAAVAGRMGFDSPWTAAEHEDTRWGVWHDGRPLIPQNSAQGSQAGVEMLFEATRPARWHAERDAGAAGTGRKPSRQSASAIALQGVLQGASLSRRSLLVAHQQSWAGSAVSNSMDGWGNCWGLGWLRKPGAAASAAAANSVTEAWGVAANGSSDSLAPHSRSLAWTDAARAAAMSFLSRTAGLSRRWGSHRLGGSGVAGHQPALVALAAAAQCSCRVNRSGSATSAALLVAARRAWQATAAFEALTHATVPPALPGYLRLPPHGLRPASAGEIDVESISAFLRRLGYLDAPTAPLTPETDEAASFADAVARSVPGMRHLALYWRRACGCTIDGRSGARPSAGQAELELARAVAATELAAASAGPGGADQGAWRRLLALLSSPSQLIAPWSCLHAWAEAEQQAEAGLVRTLGLGEVSIRGALLAGGQGWLLRGSLDGQGVVEREEVARDAAVGGEASRDRGYAAKAWARRGNSTSGSLTLLASDPSSPIGLWDSVVVLAHLLARDSHAGSASGAASGSNRRESAWQAVNEEEIAWVRTDGAFGPHWLVDPRVLHGEGGHTVADSAVSEQEHVVVTTWSSLLALLCVYARLHLRQQIHLLRVGMMVLFACTGDLEDAVATIIWTSMCLALRVEPLVNALLLPAQCCLPLHRRERGSHMPSASLELDTVAGDKEMLDGQPVPCNITDGAQAVDRRARQASAEHCAYLSAVVLGFCASVAVGLGICIALPEFCSEVARTAFAHRLELRAPSGEALAKVLQGLQA